MKQTAMQIRQPETLADAIATHNLLSLVFGKLPAEQEQASAAEAWLTRRAGLRKLIPTTTWSAFDDAACLGSYQIDQRTLRLGGALVEVGCIGAVATNPEYRNQGVASKLMHHAETFARQQGMGLLLLHGIGNFYQRFGYTNVADTSLHHIRLADLEALPPSNCHVRPATLDDTEALLALYERHYRCFVRPLGLQQAQLQRRLANPPLLAINPAGAPCGYLLAPDPSKPVQIEEAGADHWEAARALLQQHASIVRSTAVASSELIWSASKLSQTYYLLADNLPLQSVSDSIPNAEWMARVAALPKLFATLLPAWQRGVALHPEALRWVIDGEAIEIQRGQGQLQIAPTSDDLPEIQLSQKAFTSLLFGYRSVAWAARQPGSSIPQWLLPLIEQLVGANELFVPKSDEF